PLAPRLRFSRSRAIAKRKATGPACGSAGHFVRHWHAGWNRPGSLPETEPLITISYEDARNFITTALEEVFDRRCAAGDVPDWWIEEFTYPTNPPSEFLRYDSGHEYWIKQCEDTNCKLLGR